MRPRFPKSGYRKVDNNEKESRNSRKQYRLKDQSAGLLSFLPGRGRVAQALLELGPSKTRTG